MTAVCIFAYHAQVVSTYCTTDSALRHLFLLLILQATQTHTTAVSLIQLIIGDFHDVPINIQLFVNQVSMMLHIY